LIKGEANGVGEVAGGGSPRRDIAVEKKGRGAKVCAGRRNRLITTKRAPWGGEFVLGADNPDRGTGKWG